MPLVRSQGDSAAMPLRGVHCPTTLLKRKKVQLISKVLLDLSTGLLWHPLTLEGRSVSASHVATPQPVT